MKLADIVKTKLNAVRTEAAEKVGLAAAAGTGSEPKPQIILSTPFTGELREITEAPDEAFAGRMTGDGFMVYPTDNMVVAPADGEVTLVFATKHAIGLVMEDGTEYLLHIGIDTVKLNGEGFKVFVKNGQKVKKGDKLMEFDDAYIKAHAPSDACIMVMTGMEEGREVKLLKTGAVKALDEVATY